jgi:hypothetical protein
MRSAVATVPYSVGPWVERLELQSLRTNTLIDITAPLELITNTYPLGKGILMATIALPVNGKKVAVDRISIWRSILQGMGSFYRGRA